VAAPAVEASAVVNHHATTATSPATLPVSVPNPDLKPATTAAKMDISRANVTSPITADQEAMETATVTATAAANLVTFLVTAPMVDPVATLAIIANATLAAISVTFHVTAIRAPVARCVLEETKAMMNTTTDRR